MLLIITGVIAIAYFIGIAFFTGLSSKFPLVWLVLGLGLLVLGILTRSGRFEWNMLPRILRITLSFVLVAGFLLFFIVEGLIGIGFQDKSEDNLDYVIVLGALLREDGPSRVLRMRLEKAYEYLEKNKETIVIVSGGQGSNEPMSEAEGMYRYLCERGIDSKRILRECESVNTHQNLRNSMKLIEKEGASVGMISSNFHIYRAIKLAQKVGYKKVCGIPAKSEPFLLPNHMAREFCGVMKDFWVGNL